MPAKPPAPPHPPGQAPAPPASAPNPTLQRAPELSALAHLGATGPAAPPRAPGAPGGGLAPHVAIQLARSVPIFGAFAPETFGDPAREDRHAREAAAVSALPWLGHVVVTGADRLAFLDETCTARVGDRTPGDTFPATFTTTAGQPVAVAQVDVGDEEVRLEVRADRVEPLLQHLRRQPTTAEVELAPTAAWLVFTVVGPEAASVLAAVSGVDGEELAGLPHDRWREVPLGGAVARLRPNHRRLGRAAFDVTVGAEAGVTAWDTLVRGGAKALGARALEALRVEAGYAELVVDLPLDRSAMEAPSVAATVDLTKPRFTGLEALRRGGEPEAPRRVLVGLRLRAAGGAPPPAEGQPLFAPPPAAGQAPAAATNPAAPPRSGDDPVGRLGTVAASPALGAIALALVDVDRAAPGTVLTTPSGATAEVCALPFRA